MGEQAQPSESGIGPPRSPLGDSVGERIFKGRTGAGFEVVVDEVNAWLDVRYVDTEGHVRGFSLNPLYAGRITRALVSVLTDRAERAL